MLQIAFASEGKCGVKAPICVFRKNGTPQRRSLTPLTSGLVCDRTYKLLITAERLACCQPKVVTTTTTTEPTTAALDEGFLVDQINKYTDIVNNLIANADNVSEDEVNAQIQGILTDFTAAAALFGISV